MVYEEGATASWIFKIGISKNIKYVIVSGFCESGHNLCQYNSKSSLTNIWILAIISKHFIIGNIETVKLKVETAIILRKVKDRLFLHAWLTAMHSAGAMILATHACTPLSFMHVNICQCDMDGFHISLGLQMVCT